MTANNEDPPKDPELESGGDDGFDGFEGGDDAKGNLAAAWKDNPLVKIGIIVGGLVFLVGGIILFGSGGEDPNLSRMVPGTQMTEVPGTAEVTQDYRERIEETDTQRVEEAIRTGGSAIPTPIAPPVGRVTLPEEDAAEDDPLERWRRIQEERQRRVEEKPDLPQVDPNAEVTQSLAEAMAAQMESILQNRTPQPPKYAVITPPDFDPNPAEEDPEGDGGGEGGGDDGGGGGGDGEEEVVNIKVPAGTIEYAQLITEADSDVPGPIMARILSGPLKGSRLLGSFEVQDEYLVLNFDTIVIDGVSQSVSAVAMNPQTTKIGMVTDVDHKYFQRIILPAAAKFIEGFAEAVASTGGTSVSVDGDTVVQEEEDLDTREELLKGVEEAAGEFSDILSDEGKDAEVQVVVAAGTPMGILFLQPVTEE